MEARKGNVFEYLEREGGVFGKELSERLEAILCSKSGLTRKDFFRESGNGLRGFYHEK
jgi:hypothetical protein